MTITPQVTNELLDLQTGRFIALPPRNMLRAGTPIPQLSMLVLTTPPHTPPGHPASQPQLPSPSNSTYSYNGSNADSPAGRNTATSSNRTNNDEPVYYNSGVPWSREEHARFQVGMELFPSGPWKAIARCVGTRTARQTMSHAQKYRQRIIRRKRIQQEGRKRRQQSAAHETEPNASKKEVAKLAASAGADVRDAKEKEAASSVVEQEAKSTADVSGITTNSLDETIDMLLDVHLASDNMLEPLTRNDELLVLTDDELTVLLG